MRHVKPIAKYIKREVVGVGAYSLAVLVSFAYNVGMGAFKKSSVWKYFQAGDVEKAAYRLRKWVKADGKVRRGLKLRRLTEERILMGTVHLIREKQIEKWARGQELTVEERIRNIRHSEAALQRTLDEVRKELDEKKKQLRK